MSIYQLRSKTPARRARELDHVYNHSSNSFSYIITTDYLAACVKVNLGLREEQCI